MGQFEDIKAHLRALRDVSEIINDGSGKVVHEVTPDGTVYFGANEDPGNTDETSKFPSAVALIWRWTGDDVFRNETYDFSRRGDGVRRGYVRRGRRRVAPRDWATSSGRDGRGEAGQHRPCAASETSPTWRAAAAMPLPMSGPRR